MRSPTPADVRTDCGLVFGKGAMRGTFQAGVVHAFVLSGVFPGLVAGTSIGALSGAALVTAARLESHADRMALVDELLQQWRDHPGRELTTRMLAPQSRARRLAEDLLDIRLPLATLIERLATIPEGRLAQAWLLLCLVVRLPWRRRLLLGLVLSFFSVAFAFITRRGSYPLHAAQAMLTAYGMRRGLFEHWVGERYFERLARWLPRPDVRLDELASHGSAPPTTLLVQVANLSRASPDTGGAAVLTMPPVARLEPTLRAAVAMAPVFRPVLARDAVAPKAPGDPMPGGLRPKDVLADAGEVEERPISVAVRHWRAEPAAGPSVPKTLLVVHHTPTATPAPTDLGFIEAALHSWRLSEQRDSHFDQRVTGLISTLTETIEATGEVARPPGRPDQRYVVVHPESIAPQTTLPPSLSLWTDEEIGSAIAEGCRAALSTLHAVQLRELGTAGDTVPCTRLRRRLGDRHPRRRAAGWFQPCERACRSCPGVVPVPVAKDKSGPGPEPSPDVAPLPSRPSPSSTDPLTIAVPAGGVFRGVFQVGTIAALTDYRLRPDLFAGASVGTLFAYLMESASRPGDATQAQRLRSLVDLMLTIPQWVDRNGPRGDAETQGRVDGLATKLRQRWIGASGFEAVPTLHSLRPRQLVDLLTTADDHQWGTYASGLAQLLVTPAGRPEPPLARAEVQGAVTRAVDGDYHGLIALGERVLTAWGIVQPGAADRSELIGFDSVSTELRRVVSIDEGRDPPLHEWGQRHGVRFLFSGTNFTEGKPVVFGEPWKPSPAMVQAALAASSFPVAFRPRRHDEVFPKTTQKTPAYIDGGVFNNFPSDIAFAFLRRLSGAPDYRWLGAPRHRVLLLSLDPPGTAPSFAPGDRRALMNWARARKGGRDDKVFGTWVTQQHITHLATLANPLLRAQPGREQAMQVDFDLIEPARFEYPHAFAFKPWLGFSPDKQRRLLAGGCRRARLAFEWREFRAAAKRRSLSLSTDELIHRFNHRVYKQRQRHRSDDTGCIFGQMSPQYRETGQAPRCAFVRLFDDDTGLTNTEGQRLQATCREQARRDPPLRSLPIYGDDLRGAGRKS